MATKAVEDIHAFMGKRIREERKARGMTLEDVASRAMTSASYLHNLETNKKRASIVMVSRIAGALNVPIDALFKGAPTRKTEDLPTLRRITELVREAPPARRAAILKVVKTLSRPD